MTIPARWSGTCSECGGRWQPGDLIRCGGTGAPHTDGTSCWVHAVCSDDDPLEHDHPVCQTCWLTHPEGACDR